MRRILALAALALPLGAAAALADHGHDHDDRAAGHEARHGDGHAGHHGGGHGASMGYREDRGGHHGKGRGGMRRMERALEMIDTFDADGDGKVTQQEVDAYRAGRLEAFDADGDGALTLEEYERLWLDAMRARMVDRFQRHDDDGDGRITAEEFGSRSRHLVTMRDRDGDGAFGVEDLRPGRRNADPRGTGQDGAGD